MVQQGSCDTNGARFSSAHRYARFSAPLQLHIFISMLNRVSQRLQYRMWPRGVSLGLPGASARHLAGRNNVSCPDVNAWMKAGRLRAVPTRPLATRPVACFTRRRPCLLILPSSELYEELQSLPEVLRSEYPDLAVDFLATVFREPPAHPARWAAGRGCKASAAEERPCSHRAELHESSTTHK